MLLRDFLEKYRIFYQENKDTSRLSSIKAGGFADLFIQPRSEEELILALRILADFATPYKIIGSCRP